MANNFVVDSFTVEIGFAETVTKGLARLEKQLLPAANRIEKTLNRAFKVDASKITAPGINRMVKNVEQAGRKINKTLTNAFKVDNLGRGSLRSFENEGSAAARRVAREMRKAFNQTRPLPSTTPTPGARPPRTTSQRLTPAQRINELAQRQTTSAHYGNLQLRAPERAAEYRQRLNQMRVDHLMSGDLNQFRASVRRLNFEFAQTTRQQSIARQAERAAAAQAETGLGGLAGAASGLVAGFFALGKAIEYFQESLQVGIQRYQSRVSFEGAFGGAGSDNAKHMEEVVGGIIDKYGLNKAESQQTVANLRYSLPQKAFSDEQVAKLFENESIFAHQTGMTADQVFRTNHILAETADMKHMGGAQIMAMSRDAPALFAQMAKQHGMTADEYREHLKEIPGVDAVKEAVDTMAKFNIQTKAAAGAMHNVQASLGRYQNALDDQKEAFFKGYSDGFQNLLNSLTMNLKDSQGVFNTFGKILGWVFNKMASMFYLLDEVTSNIRGALGLLGFYFKDFYNGLDKDTRDKLDALASVFKSGLSHLVEIALGIFGIKAAGGAGRLAAGALGRAGGAVGSTGLARAAGFLRVGIVSMERGVIAMLIAGLLNHKVNSEQERAKAAGMTWGEYEHHKLEEHEKNKKPLFDYDNWQWVKDFKGRWKDTVSAPMLPGMSPGMGSAIPKQVVEVHNFVHFDGQLGGKLDSSDLANAMLKPVDVNDLIQGHHESVMTTATGLSGNWQTQGQSAGWKPSMLMKQTAQ